MKLSTRGQYATRAMLQIALHAAADRPMPLREIAEREGLSEQYLEQIFMDLRRAGLVESVRGAYGGYLLRRRPEQIFVGDILRAVEGPIAPVECLADGECQRQEECVTRRVWQKLQQSMLKVVDETSLADMVAMARDNKGDEKDA